jgi:hypothetical protein
MIAGVVEKVKERQASGLLPSLGPGGALYRAKAEWTQLTQLES